MPVYLYQGIESGDTFNLEQRISEAALTHHPKTGEPVKRLIGKPAISFKGSGFYANDSKNTASSKPEAAKPEAKTESPSEPNTQSESKPAESSKPAEAPAAAPTPAPTVKSDAA